MSHEAPPPDAQLFQAMFGFMVSKSVSAAADLGVADHLAAGPLPIAELATAVGGHERSLHRVMRVLTSTGIFAEPEPGVFALTPVSEFLRSDLPQSFRGLASMITSESHWLPWGRFTDTVRTGESGPQHAFGTDIFSWFQRSENARQWDIFDDAMTSFSAITSQAVTQAYDFSQFRRIIDIGGGHGYLLKTVLASAPGATGILFDLTGVTDRLDDEALLQDRIEAFGGDFFEAVPGGGDCYILKHIIHDWDDEACGVILSNIAEVLEPGGRVILIETVMPDSPEPHPAKFMDINMLAMTEGGRERTEGEFAVLFRSAGLALQAIYPTESPVLVIEAAKAE